MTQMQDITWLCNMMSLLISDYSLTVCLMVDVAAMLNKELCVLLKCSDACTVVERAPS